MVSMLAFRQTRTIRSWQSESRPPRRGVVRVCPDFIDLLRLRDESATIWCGFLWVRFLNKTVVTAARRCFERAAYLWEAIVVITSSKFSDCLYGIRSVDGRFLAIVLENGEAKCLRRCFFGREIMLSSSPFVAALIPARANSSGSLPENR